MAVRNSATGEDLVDCIAEDDMAYYDENHQPKTHLLQDAVEYGDGGAIAREKINQSNGSMLLILIASAMAAIGGVLFGYDMGIISGAMLQLKFQFDLSCIEQEMIVSSVLVGALIGSLLGGFVIDRFGRRLTIITNAVVFVVGAVILCLSQTFATLIIGRLIVGFAVAVSAIGECIYISEIAPSEKRGQLVLLNEVGISLGFLLAYLVNYVFIDVSQGWRYMFLLSAIPAVIQGVGSFYLPSSPRFLLLKNKDSEAFEKLKMLRGGADVTEELNAIRASIQTEQGHSVLDLFKSDDNMRQRMFIGIGLVFFQQATGQANVLYYAPTVFQLLGFHDDSAATLAAVGIGCIKLVAAVGSVMCVDKFGRKKLLLVGAGCMAIVIIVLGAVVKLPSSSLDRNLCKNLNISNLWDENSDAIRNSSHVTRRDVFDATRTLYSGQSSFSAKDLPYKVEPSNFKGIRYSQYLKETTLKIEDKSNSGERNPRRNISFNLNLGDILNLEEGVDKDVTQMENSDLKVSQLRNKRGLLRSQRSLPGQPVALSTSPQMDDDVKFSTLAKTVALISLMAYVAAYTFSFGPITWLILCEIFPARIRGRASSLTTSMNWGTNIIFTFTFLDLLGFMGMSSLLFIYGALCVLSMVFIYFKIPETRNKSLEEISHELASRSSTDCCSCFKKLSFRRNRREDHFPLSINDDCFES